VTAAHRGSGGVELTCRHTEQERDFRLVTDAVILASGYAARRPALLDPLAELIDWDTQGRYRIDADYRVALRPEVTGRLYVQNAELHTHGVGAPDLGLGAHRAAVILNSVTGRTAYRLPRRTAFTTFGIPDPDHGNGNGNGTDSMSSPTYTPLTIATPEAACVHADAR
jgi:lysine N6-hydroxylase